MASRMVASTKLNEDSSRSHSVCMIKLNRDKAKDSNLWVVDLAGSERIGRTGVCASSARQKEANNINKSLSTLWHCLTIMRSNLRKDEPEARVPFRESKLTHLFKNHLKGPAAGKTVMVVNINPSIEDFDETQQVLKNSTIAREVKTVKDASAANRQNGLINTHYGFNGRKMQVKKPAASRRSIHQAVAPKLENLGPPPSRKTPTKSAVYVEGCSRGRTDTDCASTADDDHERQQDDGYLSGAESDSGLVDTRQSMNLVVKNLQVDNEILKSRLKAILASKTKQPIPGGPVERYIALLEDKVIAAEDRLQQMREEHRLEVGELEREFDSFVEENKLDGDNKSAALVSSLEEEARVAKQKADHFEKEAETLRVRLEVIESRTSPLRESLDSTKNRQDGENSPPVAKKIGPAPGGVGSPKNAHRNMSNSPSGLAPGGVGSPKNAHRNMSNSPSGLAPGGVGSPSKNAHRHMSNSPKTKASALPTKKNTTSPAATKQLNASNGATPSTLALNNGVTGSSSKNLSVVTTSVAVNSSVSDGHAPPGAGGTCEAAHGGGNKQGKVIVAVSRRVSVLRVSNAGTGRVSNARPSLAGRRRKSRGSHAAAGGRRLSQRRADLSSGFAQNNAVALPHGTASADADTSKTAFQDARNGSWSTGGGGSRRESVMAMEEDNFLEKARRCMLRAIGLNSQKGILSAESGGGSFRAGRTVPKTAEEIEAQQKIKVKMPRRPTKKTTEGSEGIADPLWGTEQQSDRVVEEEDRSPCKTASDVVNGIERWVFGSKSERSTPKAKRTPEATADSSPVPSQGSATKTIQDYVRAM
ncbi:unnamed protein product [Ascophyllum nodosum]